MFACIIGLQMFWQNIQRCYSHRSSQHIAQQTFCSTIQDNQQLTNELPDPIIRKLKKWKKVLLTFWDNILGSDLADIQLTIALFYFLIRAIDKTSNYSLVDLLKDKKVLKSSIDIKYFWMGLLVIQVKLNKR